MKKNVKISSLFYNFLLLFFIVLFFISFLFTDFEYCAGGNPINDDDIFTNKDVVVESSKGKNRYVIGESSEMCKIRVLLE
jgi:hypothetical protein